MNDTPEISLASTRRNLLICFAGLPGSGKSTLAAALKGAFAHSNHLIDSESIRGREGFTELLKESDRPKLHRALRVEVAKAVEGGIATIIVDANLVEKSARALVSEPASRHRYFRFLVAPHASLETIFHRTRGKFGTKRFFDIGSFGPAEAIDHCIYTMEPVFDDEAFGQFDAIFFLETDTSKLQMLIYDDNCRSYASRVKRALIDCCPSGSRSVVEPSTRPLRLAGKVDPWCWSPEVDGVLARLPSRPISFYSRVRLMGDGLPDLDSDERRGIWDFSQSYLGRLRSMVGGEALITTSVRAVIRRKDDGKIALIRRSDNGSWALPGGAQELHESIQGAVAREVREEAGLDVDELTLTSVSSDAQVMTDRFGMPTQRVVFTFRVDSWSGELGGLSNETTDAQWFAEGDLPLLSRDHLRSLHDAIRFDGTVRVH